MALTREEILALDIKVRGGRQARQELDRTADATKRAARTTDKASRSAASSAAEVRKSVARVRNVFLLTSFAIGATVVALDRFAKRAEQISSVSRAFETLTNRVDESAEAILGGMQRATQGFVSNVDLMKQANNALILGLPITAESMEEVAQGATRLGRALGIDATRAIESVVTGIGRQSRLMLDNVGIIADFELAHLRTAAALGKEVDQLTSAETKMSDWNHVAELIRQKSTLLVDDIDLLSDRFLTLSVRVRNSVDEFLGFVNTIGSGSLENQLDVLFLQLEAIEAKVAIFRPTVGPSKADQREIDSLNAQITAIKERIELRQQDAAIRKKMAQDIDDAQRAAQAAEKALLETRAARKIVTEDLVVLERELANITLSGAGATFAGRGEGGRAGQISFEPFAAQLEGLDVFHSISLELVEEFESQVTAVERRNADERILIANRERAMKIQFQQELSSAVFGLLGGLFGENKLFAIAESIINTHLAVTKTLASLPYPANLAAAAKVSTIGVLNTAAIAATSFRSTGGGGGGGGFGGATTPFTPSPPFTGPARGPLEITIHFDGEAFIFGTREEFAQDIWEEIARQANLGGQLTGSISDG